jgi:hypothetical protein
MINIDVAKLAVGKKSSNFKVLISDICKKIAILLLAVSFTLAALLNPHPATAQRTDLDLSIKPSVTYLDIEPNQQKTYQLLIAHNGSTPLEISPQVVEFAPDIKTGIPQLDFEAKINFVTFKDEDGQPVQQFKLLPHTQQQLTVVVNPPLDIIQKEYHLSLLLKAESANQPSTESKTGSITSAIVASNLIALVSSEEIGSGPITIDQIQAKSIFDSLKPLKFKVRAKNEGIKAAPVKGKVRILNWLNQEVGNFPLATTIILGESSRNLSYYANGTPAAELDQKIASIPLNDEFYYDQPFLIGPFTLEASLESTSEQKNTLIIQKRVLALPISLLVILLLACSTYLLVIYLRIKKSLLPSLKKSFNLNNNQF